jgi:hypothetical protein
MLHPIPAAALRPVREFALRHNAKIYVGEFSAIAWAEGAENYLPMVRISKETAQLLRVESVPQMAPDVDKRVGWLNGAYA